MALQLFRKKSPDHLIAEAAAPERQMKRALGPFALTCIGIGAIIGTGIFALAGTAAAGEQLQASILKTPVRSEERRVGKECRSRWSPYHLKKKKKRVWICGRCIK